MAALMPKKPQKKEEGGSFILYSEPKAGKTTSLDDPNMKVLLLDLEDGESVLDGAPNVDVVKIRSLEHLNAYGELLAANKWINENGEIKDLEHSLIAIDTVTRLQDLVKDYVVRVVAPNRQREIKDGDYKNRFGARSDWGNFGDIISDLFKYFHSLTKRGSKSFNVFWLAHKDNKYENPTVETMVTGTQIKMQGGSVPVVMSVVDGIFYMNKGELTNKAGDTQMCYWVQTDRVGITEAGVRQSRREEKLPTRIFNPVWSDILTKLGYKVDLLNKEEDK